MELRVTYLRASSGQQLDHLLHELLLGVTTPSWRGTGRRRSRGNGVLRDCASSCGGRGHSRHAKGAEAAEKGRVCSEASWRFWASPARLVGVGQQGEAPATSRASGQLRRPHRPRLYPGHAHHRAIPTEVQPERNCKSCRRPALSESRGPEGCWQISLTSLPHPTSWLRISFLLRDKILESNRYQKTGEGPSSSQIFLEKRKGQGLPPL